VACATHQSRPTIESTLKNEAVSIHQVLLTTDERDLKTKVTCFSETPDGLYRTTHYYVGLLISL
jgi:hypothetical protein